MTKNVEPLEGSSYFSTFASDLSERKQMEAVLRASEERFRSVLENVNLIAMMLDREGRLIFANDYLLELTGWQREEVLGEDGFNPFFPAEQVAPIRTLFLDTIATGEYEQHYEGPLVTRAGELRWIAWSDSLHLDVEGKPVAVTSIGEDITERKRMEAALQRSEARFRSVLENAAMIGLMFDRNGRVIFANDYFLELSGWQRQDVLGKLWFEKFLPAAQVGTIKELFLQTVMTGEFPLHYENPIVTSSGEERLIAWSNSVQPGPDGKPESVTSLGVDITEQKRYAQALQESEEHFRLLYEQAPMPYQSLDKDGNILNVNSTWLEALGYEREQVLGRWFGDFLAPESRTLFPQCFAQFQQAGEARDVAFEMLHHNGRRISVLFDGRVGHTTHGTFQQTHCVWRDVTAIQKAQRALQASEALLNRAEEVAGMGSFEWDLRTDELSWSRNMYLINGVDPATPMGKLNTAMQAVVHPQDRERVQAEVARMAESGLTWPMEFRVLHSDDGERLLYSTSEFVFDERGAPVRCVGVNFDITERRQAEQALQESERTLAALMSNLPGMAYRCRNDADWSMIFVSEGCRTLTGYSRMELIDARQIAYNEVIHPEDRALVAQQVQSALAEKQPFAITYRIRTAGGELKWVWERGSGIYATSGEALFVEGLILDISERVFAEQALRESEARFRKVFAESPIGIALISAQGAIIDGNERLCRFLGYARNELCTLNVLDVTYPADMDMDAVLFEKLINGQLPAYKIEKRFLSKTGELLWGELTATLIEEEDSQGLPMGQGLPYGQANYCLGMVADITERRRTQIALENYANRLQEYADRLEMLYELGQDFLKAESMKDVARIALERIHRLGICRRTSVLQIDAARNSFRVLATIPEDNTSFYKEGAQLPVMWDDPAAERIRERKPDYWEVASIDKPLNAMLNRYGIWRVFMAPLLTPAGALGVLNLGLVEEQRLSEEQHIQVVQIANMLALALNQAQLTTKVHEYAQEMYQSAVQRRRDLETMYQVAAVANETQDLTSAMRAALERVLPAMRCQIGLIHLLDSAEQALKLVAELGVEPRYLPMLQEIDRDLPIFRQAFENARPISSTAAAADLVGELGIADQDLLSVAIMPVRALSENAGLLSLVRLDGERGFEPEELDLLAAISDHLGIIVSSARLRERAEQAAADEERQRLARELHDAVSQTLFSASVIAEALPRLWLRNPDLVRESLDELQRLTRGALAEMRTLLVELRPGAFEQAALEELLGQLADGLSGRTRLQVHVQLSSEAGEALPAPVRLVFYRIAQEGLNNIVKHARASQVWLSYRSQAGRAELSILDDGRGFRPGEATGGHFGLKIMQERAQEIGARVLVESQPGNGTQVELIWETD